MAAQTQLHCEHLRTIVKRVDRLVLGQMEEDPIRLTHTVGQLGELLRCALSALADIDNNPSSDSDPFDAREASSLALDEYVFMARLELCHFGGWLFEQKGPLDPGHIIERCEQLQRQLLATLVDVEIALCEALREPSQLGAMLDAQLECSRAIRRAYYSFITVVDTLAEGLAAGRLSYPEALHAGTAALAELVDDPLFETLSHDHRGLVESLHCRLLAWSELHPEDELEARRLWSALCSCALQFADIQSRPELMEHDWTKAYELLWSAGLERCVATRDPELFELGTRDPELAAALAGGRDATIGRCLQRLHDALALALGRPSLAARREAVNVISI